jgi:hypothetical protein
MFVPDAEKRTETMETEVYKGYSIYGHSIEQKTGYGASGTVVRDERVVQSSGILAIFSTEEEALHAGLEWAREWIDGHN